MVGIDRQNNRNKPSQARKTEYMLTLAFRGEVPRPEMPIFLDLPYLETADADFDLCFCPRWVSQTAMVYSVSFDCE